MKETEEMASSVSEIERGVDKVLKDLGFVKIITPTTDYKTWEGKKSKL